jgi:hypothetical protein
LNTRTGKEAQIHTIDPDVSQACQQVTEIKKKVQHLLNQPLPVYVAREDQLQPRLSHTLCGIVTNTKKNITCPRNEMQTPVQREFKSRITPHFFVILARHYRETCRKSMKLLQCQALVVECQTRNLNSEQHFLYKQMSTILKPHEQRKLATTSPHFSSLAPKTKTIVGKLHTWCNAS